jgi:hypothetical protein
MTLCEKIPAFSILCLIVTLFASSAALAANGLHPASRAQNEEPAGQSGVRRTSALEEMLSRQNGASGMMNSYKQEKKNEPVPKRSFTPVLERYVTGGMMTFAW